MEASATAHDIMVVDDTPEILAMTEELLRRLHYEVRAFSRARPAILAAAQRRPDLILLDITMPEMDGYAACRALKADARTADVPVIFVTALGDTPDKVKGFAAGAVDYILKPFDPAEVQARVETQLKLRQLQLAERELLEKTLNGAVTALVELVGLAAPDVGERGRSVSAIVTHAARRLDLPSRWQYELAARLCLIGWIALPDDLVAKAQTDVKLTDDEARMFAAHPALAQRLLSGIPRLESVAEIVGLQREAPGKESRRPEVATGAELIRVAMALDRELHRGESVANAINALRAAASKFDERILGALEGYEPEVRAAIVQSLRIGELRAAMVLEDDVTTPEGMLLARKGITLTAPLVARLKNFAEAKHLTGFVRVRLAGTRSDAESDRAAA